MKPASPSSRTATCLDCDLERRRELVLRILAGNPVLVLVHRPAEIVLDAGTDGDGVGTQRGLGGDVDLERDCVDLRDGRRCDRAARPLDGDVAPVNVASWIGVSNVTMIWLTGPATFPLGLTATTRGPAEPALRAAYASTMPPVTVTPDRPGRDFTVESTRSTSHEADSVGWSPASRETTPVT